MNGGSNRQQRRQHGREHNISVRGIQRNPVDLRKLSRVLLAIAEREAQAAHETREHEEVADESA
jgi:hypothetical protein